MKIPSSLLLLLWLTAASQLGCQDQAPLTGQLTAIGVDDVYRLHCSSCHGDGSGNGHVASALKVPPRNLRLRQWQESVTDRQVEQVILYGGLAAKLSEAMPAFDNQLSKSQVTELVGYIRRLAQ